MVISEALQTFKTYYLLNNDRSDKTRREYRTRLLGRNGLVTIVGDMPIERLGVDHVITWKLHLRDEGLQAGYINDMLSSLRWFLKWLDENEFNVMPWRSIDFEKEERGKLKTLLTPNEVERLKNVTKNMRDRAIIDLFFGSGIRAAELLEIDRYEWEGVVTINEADVVVKGDEPVWEIEVMGKNKKYRPAHFSQSVKDTVDAYLETRIDRYRPLFTSQQHRRISYQTVNRMIHDVAARAGLEKRVTPHVFRHSNATELAVSGMPIPVLAAHLGHADGSVTQKIYVNEISAIQNRRAYTQHYKSLKSKV